MTKKHAKLPSRQSVNLNLTIFYLSPLFFHFTPNSEFEESLDKLEDSVSGSGMSGSCEQPPPSARDSSFSQTSEYSTVEEKIYPSPQIKTNVFDMDVMFEKFDDPFLW